MKERRAINAHIRFEPLGVEFLAHVVFDHAHARYLSRASKTAETMSNLLLAQIDDLDLCTRFAHPLDQMRQQQFRSTLPVAAHTAVQYKYLHVRLPERVGQILW